MLLMLFMLMMVDFVIVVGDYDEDDGNVSNLSKRFTVSRHPGYQSINFHDSPIGTVSVFGHFVSGHFLSIN